METIRITSVPPTMDNKVEEARRKMAQKLRDSIDNEEKIADHLGRKPKVDDHPLLDRFVKGVDAAYKTQLNIRAMQRMLERVQNNQPTVTPPRTKSIKQLSIMYRNGTIQPKNSVSRTQ